jgi:4-amino-4-deoxy-L-arabinose transferase-like glycosyltransferase
VAVHDIGVVPFLCIAALSIVRVANAADSGGSSPFASAFKWNIVFHGIIAGVALGLSILTKGLVGIAFTGIFAACLMARRRTSLAGVTVALIVAVVVAIAVAAPWYLAMERAHPGYLHYYFVERHLQGYLTATQRHAGRPIWYYVPIVVGGALPWTAYLVGAARTARANSLRLALWGWFATGLVFLSAGESKLVTYALPLFPALALIIGEYLAGLAGHPPRAGDVLFKLALAAHALALALLPALGLIAIQWKFGAVHPYLWVGVAILGLLAIYAARRAARSHAEHAYMAGVVRMTVYTIVAMMIVAPRAAAWMTGRDLAAALNAAGSLPSHVSVVDERIGSLIFYLDPSLRATATADRVDTASFSEAMTRIRTDPADALTAVRNSQLPRFNRLFPSPPVADARAGTYSVFRADTLRKAFRIP